MTTLKQIQVPQMSQVLKLKVSTLRLLAHLQLKDLRVHVKTGQMVK